MTYQKIKFMSRSSMNYLKPESDAIVISITSPGLEHIKFKEGFKDVLLLEFDNVDRLMNGMVRFSLSHAKDIMTFVQKHQEDASTIYVNCLQGESRSAALAHFLADYYKMQIEGNLSKEQKWVYEVMARANGWKHAQYMHLYKK